MGREVVSADREGRGALLRAACSGQKDGSQLQIHKGILFCKDKVKGKSGGVTVQQIGKEINGSELYGIGLISDVE